MNVDTGDLTEVVRQVAELSRKVSALSGRVTVMGNALNRAQDGLIPVATAYWLGVDAGRQLALGPGRPQPPQRVRLRVIDGGRR